MTNATRLGMPWNGTLLPSMLVAAARLAVVEWYTTERPVHRPPLCSGACSCAASAGGKLPRLAGAQQNRAHLRPVQHKTHRCHNRIKRMVPANLHVPFHCCKERFIPIPNLIQFAAYRLVEALAARRLLIKTISPGEHTASQWIDTSGQYLPAGKRKTAYPPPAGG